MKDSELKKSSILYEGGRNKIQEIWFLQKEIHDNFEQGKINEKCIFLVGDTNAGKTTLLYYLSGMRLKLQENPMKKTKEMRAIQVYENAIICNTLSTTQIPNLFTKNQGPSEVSLVDMPGMNDNRPLSLISNIFTFEQIFQKIDTIKQIHIVFVISQETLDAQDIKQNIREFIQHFNIENFEASKNISLIFTKTQDDLETVKEIFFQHLEAIKEDIQDEEEQDIARFIQILTMLNSQEDLTYCFPGQEPNQEQGLKIAESIVKRNQFIENDKVSILNDRFIENIVQSSKLKLPSFESNINNILNNELFRTIEESLLMLTQLIKCLHKNFVSSIFENDEIFKSFCEVFCSSSNLKLISSFRNKERNDRSFTTDHFIEIIIEMCDKITQEKYLYEIDRSLKSALCCENQDDSKFSFLITFSQMMGDIFVKMEKNLMHVEKAEILIESFKNMGSFYKWISNSWFEVLSKVESLPKMTDTLTQISKDFRQLKNRYWSQLSSNLMYFEVFSSFSEKQIEQEQSGSQQQDEQQPEQIIKMVGPTLNDLRSKYTKPKYLQKVHSSIDTLKSVRNPTFSKQKQLETKVIQIVKQLEQKLLPFQKWTQSYQNGSDPTFTDKQIQMFFFQKKHLGHKIYLQSALNNFFDYLKFFLYMINLQRDRRRDYVKVVRFMESFIDNICQVLEQYLLYEEQILMYLFINNFDKAIKTMRRGFEKLRISQKFITEELITIVMDLFQKEKKIAIEKKQKISQLILKSYNYIIAEFSASRSQQQKYETQMEAKLDQIDKDAEISNPQHPCHQVKLNYSVLQSKTFTVKNILQKVNLFQQKHPSSKIYPVYKDLFPRQKKIVKPQKTSSSDLKFVQSVIH